MSCGGYHTIAQVRANCETDSLRQHQRVQNAGEASALSLASCNACFGDIDGSGVVDSGDIAFALLDFGPCPSCPSDLDGSGETDFGDIALILLSTGPCF